MIKTTVALAGALMLFAAPSFAQSSSTSNSNSATASGSASGTSQPGQPSQNVRQQLTSDLQSAGFTNVRIVPDSFLVHATNKQGQPVVMIINPDSVFTMTALPNQANGNPSGSGSSSSHLGNNPGTNGGTTHQ